MNDHNHKDLAPERQQRLLAILGREGAVRVDELCHAFGVSPATVRRDLEVLENAGHIRRVHGGAVLNHNRLHEPMFDDKTAIAGDAKRAIARAAVSLIDDGDTIFLDGGSTLLELARLLVSFTTITVVTNSLRAAAELSRGGPRLIVIGGELRRRSQTIVGALTRHPLETIHLDKAFMGTMGFTLDDGLTTTDPNEAFTKELVMRRAQQVVLLMHSGKVGNVAFARSGRVEDVSVLITDDQAEESFLKQVRKQGCKVYLAAAEDSSVAA